MKKLSNYFLILSIIIITASPLLADKISTYPFKNRTQPNDTVLIVDSSNDSNKQIYVGPKILSSATQTTLQINSDLTDVYCLTAQNGALSILSPTGTPQNIQVLVIRITDDNGGSAPYPITWATGTGGFQAADTIPGPLPTTTVKGKTFYLSFIYNSTSGMWDYFTYVGNY